jgi:hypothetical protein
MVILKSICARVCVCDMGGKGLRKQSWPWDARMGPIFQQPMRRVRHDLMGHFNFLALAHWRKIVQIDIYYDFQSLFNEHECYEEFDTCMFLGII